MNIHTIILRVVIVMVALTIQISLFAQRAVPDAYIGTATVNHIRTWDAMAPEKNVDTLIKRLLKDVRQSTQYVDGLGRPLQTILRKGSMATGDTAKDLVTSVLYDQYGRQAVNYLPFTASNTGGNASITDGKIKSNPFQQQAAFMQQQYGSQSETWFYNETKFEFSPLNRATESFAPGNSWVGSSGQSSEANRHSIKMKYWLNTTSDSVRIWNVTDVSNSFGTYATSSMYGAGLLSKNITVDEHNKQVVEFKDKEGKVILKKVQWSAVSDTGTGKGHYGWVCTYYIYDDLNNLRCVIQPEGVKALASSSWSMTSTILYEQCFRYEYDDQKRMIKKKIPGAGPVWMVYDARDRVVLTQDSSLRVQGKWMYTLYDEINRTTTSGLWTNSSNQAYHAGQAENSTAYPNLGGQTYEELTGTFYDNYDWRSSFSNPLSNNRTTVYDTYLASASNTVWPYPQDISQHPAALLKGKVTGTRTKVLGSGTYLFTASFYDQKGRVNQVQSQNINGQTDVITTQYSWAGQPLTTVDYKSVVIEVQDYTIVNKMEYDSLSRLLNVKKTIYSNIGAIYRTKTEQTIVQNEYDKLGQLKKKKLAPAYNSNAGLESLTYDYNIRGWMLGMNRAYVKDSLTNYFGFDLGYDKTGNSVSGTTYSNQQYNGNIEGMIWKSKGDGEKRKYDFTYDALDRILGADFNQYTSGSFNKTANVDFTMRNMSYDYNGNILTMSQKGLVLSSSSLIDSLGYGYVSGSNKLLYVTDKMNNADSRLGDFKETTNNTSDDYTYDVSGSLTQDNNKAISNIHYNHLNLPDSITVTGKGTIKYMYDAAGIKLKKITTDVSVIDKTIISTTKYINGGVYESRTTSPTDGNNPDYEDRLQFLGQEEGRIRINWKDSILHYDYFIKDHLGNVRMLLTEEQSTDFYPPASLETATLASEEIYYSNLEDQRTTPPRDYPSDPYTDPNEYLSELNKIEGALGPSIVLKVMEGDKFNVRVSSWYSLDGGSVGSSSNVLTELLDALNNSLGNVPGAKYTPSQLETAGTLNTPLTSFLGDQSSGTDLDMPKAFINWVLLDEQFKYVSSSSGFEQVGDDLEFKVHNLTNLPIDKNGYLYIYVSNATNNISVFFDNLQVTHIHGPIVEETHYYPFGLIMAGISSKALSFGDPKNNEETYQAQRFDDDLNLNWIQFKWRNYDPQIGRFVEVDPLSNKYEYNSTYAFSENHVTTHIELEGLEKESIHDPNVITYGSRNNPTAIEAKVLETAGSKPSLREGMFVAVVNAPKGAKGLGHNALMVGNDKTGWVFISKEGRREDPSSNSDNNGSTGGPALKPREESFNTMSEFMSNSKFKEYTDATVLPIANDQEGPAIEKMRTEAKSQYVLLTNNCGHAVNNTLESLGIPATDHGIISFKYDSEPGPGPNDMYNTIKKLNSSKIVTSVTRK